MKYDKWFKFAIYIICIAVFVSAFAIPYHFKRIEWLKFYRKINEWKFDEEKTPYSGMIFVDTSGADKLLRKEELSTTLRIEYGLEFTDTFSNDRYLTGNEGLYLMGDVVIYADQFSGNTYVINAKGDTIFKYIKKEKE